MQENFTKKYKDYILDPNKVISDWMSSEMWGAKKVVNEWVDINKCPGAEDVIEGLRTHTSHQDLLSFVPRTHIV